MPICTFCTHSIPYLYTVYESEYNLRLEQCPQCHEFVDTYVEHDSMTILLDLILLKRGVYRHLLYNRGTKPRRLVASAQDSEGEQAAKLGCQSRVDSTRRERDRWLLIFRLGSTLTFFDAFIRWSYLNPTPTMGVSPWTKQVIMSFCRVFLGNVAETITFHGGIIVTCCLLMKIMDIFKATFYSNPPPKSNIRQEFKPSHISLSLFYSSLPKIFLLLLLTIWLPTSTSAVSQPENPLPEWTKRLQWTNNNNLLKHVLEILDDDKLDREWIVRNALGGMSAGFGLRVILDIHPLFTTIMILAGWVAKTAVATLVSRWVGGNDSRTGEAWLAYSIP
ncbi:Arv1-domain-containing protein [Phlegmacium glaucopus]|nr:Arv1-domain-containing protein [Phlegmacium glaucopus]